MGVNVRSDIGHKHMIEKGSRRTEYDLLPHPDSVISTQICQACRNTAIRFSGGRFHPERHGFYSAPNGPAHGSL